jgi:5-(aminomethyl)-3-furanmethanol phosphate kinase
MSAVLTVVKVGGSLYDLPDLQRRLRGWLMRRQGETVLLVPGGGATADVVRDLDERHGLGEEKAHWLALRALSLNAAFLASLLPDARVVDHPGRATAAVSVLDPFAFALLDERSHPDRCLPHSWAATSDAVAARAAVAGGAARLILLKSVAVPTGMNWRKAAREGFVDAHFAEVILEAPALVVEAVNFRA